LYADFAGAKIGNAAKEQKYNFEIGSSQTISS
jgi:hypothetical protein